MLSPLAGSSAAAAAAAAATSVAGGAGPSDDGGAARTGAAFTVPNVDVASVKETVTAMAVVRNPNAGPGIVRVFAVVAAVVLCTSSVAFCRVVA